MTPNEATNVIRATLERVSGVAVNDEGINWLLWYFTDGRNSDGERREDLLARRTGPIHVRTLSRLLASDGRVGRTIAAMLEWERDGQIGHVTLRSVAHGVSHHDVAPTVLCDDDPPPFDPLADHVLAREATEIPS